MGDEPYKQYRSMCSRDCGSAGRDPQSEISRVCSDVRCSRQHELIDTLQPFSVNFSRDGGNVGSDRIFWQYDIFRLCSDVRYST
jgi:hypothetical protein